MKIIQPEVTIQQEVVEPPWVIAAMTQIQKITKPDNEYVIPETSYLLSREESEALVGDLRGTWRNHIPGQYTAFNAYRESLDQLWYPRKEIEYTNSHGKLRKRFEYIPAGLYRCSSSCNRCPSPFQDVPKGMDEYRKRRWAIYKAINESEKDALRQTVFPIRCRPCRALYSSRRRGRKAAERLDVLAEMWGWKFTHWIHTETVRKQSEPFTDDQIKEDKRIKMKKLSRLYESKEWYSQFTGIQVYEAKVRAPGDIVTGTRPDGTDYRREVKTFELHGHIHACIIHPKDGYVDVKKIRENYFEGSVYKDKYDLDKDSGDTRSTGKIIGDYLVGYLRKDIIGNMSWCGPRKYRWKNQTDEDSYMKEISNQNTCQTSDL